MGACFYNNAGVMAGCDIHRFFAPGPPFLFSTPVLPYGYIVAVPFFWFTVTADKRTPTVTSDSFKMIQGGFDLYFVPHVPWPAPWGLLQLWQIFEVHLMAGSKAQLTAHSVTGEREALATCIINGIGANLNCQEAGLSAPTDVVLNLSTVETSPTAGDYLGAIVGWAVDSAIGFVMDKYLPDNTFKQWLTKVAITHFWRRIGDIPYAEAADVPSQVQDSVQEWVDGK